MKKFIISALLVFSSSSFAGDCGLKVTLDLVKQALRAEVVLAEDATGTILVQDLTCSKAFLEVVEKGALFGEIGPGVKIPVVYSQSFTAEEAKTLQMDAIIRTAFGRDMLVAIAFVGNEMVLRAVHKDYQHAL